MTGAEKRRSAFRRLARSAGELPPVRVLAYVADVLYDLLRGILYSGIARSDRAWGAGLDYRILYFCHKIEKTLARPDVPTLLGFEDVVRLLRLIERRAREAGTCPALAIARAVLEAYRVHVAARLVEEHPTVARQLDRALETWDEPGAASGGAAAVLAAGRNLGDCMLFEQCVRTRRSIRFLSDEPVPAAAFERAVALAQSSPSACNRQATRVHLFTNPGQVSRILTIPSGSEECRQSARALMLVTFDTRALRSASERDLGSIDASMFAMTLVHALHSDGVASCCLNVGTHFYGDLALRRACELQPWETAVLLIAVGYPAPGARAPVSARIPTSAVLVRHQG